MGLPVAEAHPAEVVLAVEALHVVAAAVLLDADAALRALKKSETCSRGRGRDSSVGKASWIKVPQKRRKWTIVSLIASRGIGGRKILAALSMRRT